MANKKITDLVEITSAADVDVLAIVDVSADTTNKIKVDNLPVSAPVQTALDAKQATLVSGTNIKTINSTSLLGSGDIAISANPAGTSGQIQFNDSSAFGADSNLFWDNSNKRLGVGTSSPSASVGISTPYAASSLAQLNGMGLFVGYSATSFGIAIGGASTTGSGIVQGTNQAGNSASRLTLNPFGGNVAIGQVSSGTGLAQLEIKGSGSTSATTSLLVQNSSGTTALTVKDDLSTSFSGTLNIRRDETNFTMRLGNVGQENCFIDATTTNTFYLVDATFSNNFKLNNVGTSFGGSPNASAKVSVDSTTQGFLPPRMTTTQKNAISSPAEGLMVMDITTHKLCVYDGTSWVDLH